MLVSEEKCEKKEKAGKGVNQQLLVKRILINDQEKILKMPKKF